MSGGGGKKLILGIPYAWLVLFFLAPFLIVAKISLSEFRIGVPPYEPILEFLDGHLEAVHLTLNNFGVLFQDDTYVDAYVQSLTIAGLSTLACLALGYPMAYAIARARPSRRTPLLMLVILPFWTSFLVRVYAWMSILRDDGLLNNLLLGLGVIDEPMVILNTDLAVYIGIVYSYLPFMVLPLYAQLEKLDASLLEAAADLGARPWRAFLSVTLPLSWPGIVSGCLLVFIPAVGEYVIPDLLGGGNTNMLGKALWDVFSLNRDWPMASALAIAILMALVVPFGLFQYLQRRAEAD